MFHNPLTKIAYLLNVSLVLSLVALCSEVTAQVDNRPVLRFAIVNPEIGNPKEVLSSFKPLMKYMSSHLKHKIEVLVFPDVEKTVQALKEGKIMLGYTGIVDFFNIQQQFDIKPLLTIVRNKKPFYTSCLVVRRKDGILKLEALKGHPFGFTSLHKMHGGLYPQLLLKKKGFNPDLTRFFSQVKPYFSDITGIYDLIRRKIDACAMTKQTLDTISITSPALRKKLQILYQEEKLMFAPFFYRGDIEPQLKDKFIKETMTFAKTIEGRQLLMMFKVDGLTPVSNADYDLDRKRAAALGYLTNT